MTNYSTTFLCTELNEAIKYATISSKRRKEKVNVIFGRQPSKSITLIEVFSGKGKLITIDFIGTYKSGKLLL